MLPAAAAPAHITWPEEDDARVGEVPLGPLPRPVQVPPLQGEVVLAVTDHAEPGAGPRVRRPQ